MKQSLFALFFSLFGHFTLVAQPYLYGTTPKGGLKDSGLLFVFNVVTNQIFPLYSFTRAAGYSPVGSLLKAAGDKLYGTTLQGGSFDQGVLFSYDPSTGTYCKLKEFTGTDGRLPSGSLAQDASGKVYGTTGVGNNDYNGTIYSYDPATKTFANLYDFTGPEGAYPVGGLVLASNGKLYGTTLHDGSPDFGVAFCFDPSTKVYTRIRTFDGADGLYPQSPLLLAGNGKIYGVTPAGGANNNGVIFSIDPANNSFSRLYDFTVADGSSLSAGLLQATDGKLYGVTLSGGAHRGGTIFSFDPATNSFSSEYSFAGPEGYAPNGGLMEASNGKLYGTTTKGGVYNLGTLFSFDQATKVLTKSKDFSGANGKDPLASLTESVAPLPGRNYVRLGHSFVSTAFTKEGQLVGVNSTALVNNIYRYNTDGTPDASFGSGGVAEIDSMFIVGNNDRYDPYHLLDDTSNQLLTVTVDSTGRIIVNEQVEFAYGPWIPPQTLRDERLTRFTKEGTIDYSFSEHGKIYAGLAPGYEHNPGPIAVQKDSKIIFTYRQDQFAIFWRLTETGMSDYFTRFYWDNYYQYSVPVGIAFQENGKMVMELKKIGSPVDSVVFIRLNSDGSFDPSFGDGGKVAHPFVVPANLSAENLRPEYWQLLAVQSDEKIIFGTSDNKLIRLNANGSHDASFGNNGMVDSSMAIGRILVGNDDKIYVGGSQNGDFALARYNASGNLDPSFGNGGLLVDDFGGTESIQNMAIVGHTLYAFGTGILTSYQLNACIPLTFLNDATIVLDASCTGNDGNISLIPVTGNPPFQYSIDGGATYAEGGAKGHTFQNLAPGTYQLRMKDTDGCESEIVTREVRRIFGGPTFRNDQTIVLDASCSGGDGKISIIPTCGAVPFHYSIDGGANYVTGPDGGYTFQNLAAGTYHLRLKDGYGRESAIVTRNVRPNMYGPCAGSAAKSSLRSTAMSDHKILVQAYPNPTTGMTQLRLENTSGAVHILVVDSKGVEIISKSAVATEDSPIVIDLSKNAKGLYLIRVVGNTGASATKVLLH
ncbi:choice-of-anchor tandem repeat GloVer-containing protein [Flavisolibacter nicotianae]|uniref:choice-of-anchor tandem repeat GloVer-containing protein n=1 Tax=Flavisolibacter nicotianae TaxID=2364882 RepID=UPI000EB20828|nr:choice-of-anchor tandem repeat GloVer-containing protein [Flavisolibacter nicotianae]